jgi:hypothetical protein
MSEMTLHNAYNTNPICPCCMLAISKSYLREHLMHDHRKSEVAAMLATFAIDDFKQMYEEPLEA